MPEDRALELAQRRARLEPELFVEHAPRLAVCLERIRLPVAAIEREDQLTTKALPQRILGGQGGELRHELGLAAALEVGVDPSFDRGEPQLLERGRLRRRERRIDLRERRSSEQGVRGAEQPGSLGRRLSTSGLRDERAEAVEIELARLDANQIAGRLRHQAVAGANAIRVHSTTLAGAPAQHGLGRIAPFSVFDGKHFCSLDWHVLALYYLDFGDKAYVSAELAPYAYTWTLDGEPVATVSTAVRRIDPVWLQTTYGASEGWGNANGALLPLSALAPGTHTAHLVVTDISSSTVVFDDGSTFVVDAPGTGTCS